MKTTLRTALATTGAALALVGAGVLTSGAAQAADTGIPVLEAIKQCESGGSYTAQNPTSTASGAYQFLDSTWQSMDAAAGYSRAADAPEAVQDAAAIELYTEQGTTPWLASYSCWSGSGALTTGSGASASGGSTSTPSQTPSTSTTSTSTTTTATTPATGTGGEARVDGPGEGRRGGPSGGHGGGGQTGGGGGHGAGGHGGACAAA